MSYKNGVIILNKEAGMTSQTAVNKVKRLFGADKAGHTGTLDPMATGVLPILINRGVKAGEYMLSSEKHYLAECILGITTDTEDTSGKFSASARTTRAKPRCFLFASASRERLCKFRLCTALSA